MAKAIRTGGEITTEAAQLRVDKITAVVNIGVGAGARHHDARMRT